jgi:putative transposase
VWAADITYIAMQQGFLYLVAIIDWATRRVLSWRLSNTLTAGFCVEALSEALARFGKPGTFNTDQSLPSRKRGAQFTSDPKSGSWMIARWCRIGANHRDGDRNDESGGSPGG